MPYTPTTWADEVLADAERYNIKENGGAAFKANMQIELATTVASAGTPINATNLNNMEAGIVAAVRKDLVTAIGDMLYATASAVLARLGIGTPGQFLRVNSGGSAPEWADPSSVVIVETTQVEITDTTETTIFSKSITLDENDLIDLMINCFMADYGDGASFNVNIYSGSTLIASNNSSPTSGSENPLNGMLHIQLWGTGSHAQAVSCVGRFMLSGAQSNDIGFSDVSAINWTTPANLTVKVQLSDGGIDFTKRNSIYTKHTV